MKDYFDRFLKPEQGSLQEGNGEGAPPAAPQSSVIEVTAQPPAIVPAVVAREDEDHALEDDEEFCMDANKVRLWETKIKKTVLPEKLVWAPYYRFGNQLFCARICENDEIERDLYIQTPDLSKECVVEFICAPKTKAEDTRLLTVHRAKVVPYYGKNDSVGAEEPKTEWNENLIEKMKKKLKEKCKTADAAHIFGAIVERSQEYLREALAYAHAIEVATKKSLPVRTNSVGSDHGHCAGHLSSPSAPLRAHTAPHAAPDTLSVGDHIRYLSELDVDVQVFAQIIGFSGDNATPLVLDNGAKIALKKRVCKMSAVDTSISSLGYDPHSGHYQALGDFIFKAGAPTDVVPAEAAVPAALRAAPAVPTVAAVRKPATPDNGGTSAGKCAPSAAQPASAQKKSRAQVAMMPSAQAAAEVTSASSSAADAATTGSSKTFNWLSEAPLFVRAKSLSFEEGAGPKETCDAKGSRSATKRKAGAEGQRTMSDEVEAARGEVGSARKSPRRTSSDSSSGSSGGGGTGPGEAASTPGAGKRAARKSPRRTSSDSSSGSSGGGGTGPGEAASTPGAGKRDRPAAALMTPGGMTTAEAGGSSARGKSARKATPPSVPPGAPGSSSSEQGRQVQRRSATRP